MLRKKQGPNPKRKVVPVLGAAGLSLSLVAERPQPVRKLRMGRRTRQ